MKAPTNKILLVDFDGVLHSYTSGWQGADCIPDRPVPGMMEWLEEFVLSHCLGEDPEWSVCIYSARSAQRGGIEAMKAWLKDPPLGLTPIDRVIDLIDFPTQKPPAYLTIDDRCVCFDGDAKSLTDKIMNFKTWYGRTGI